MADITVNVTAPGSFTTWGQDTWSSNTFGQDSGTQLSQGTSLGGGIIQIANPVEVAPSFDLDLSLGSIVAEGIVEQGWGGDSWGENYWGNLIPSVAIPTGVEASVSLGEMAYTGSEEGWGSRTWGRGSWGIAGSVLAANFEFTTAIGTVEATGVVTQGWGGDTWGENYWGELITNVVVVSPTQLDLTISLGDLAYSQASDGWGRNTWGSSSWGIFGTVLAGQLPMTSSIGDVSITAEINAGWGANSWGNGSWGSEFSAFPVGQVANIAIGDEDAGTDFTFVIQDNAMAANVLALNGAGISIQIDGNIFVNATEHEIQTATSGIDEINGDGFTGILTGSQATVGQGNTVGGTKTPVDVAMNALSLGFNPATLQQDTVESPTGIQANLSLGNEGDIPEIQVGVSGLDINLTVGNIPEINGDGKVILTGITLTAATNTPNIFPWQEIDLGVNNTWTEVDLAA